MRRYLCKIAYTILVAAMAFAVLHSPLDQRSFGTVPGAGDLADQAGTNLKVLSTLLPTGLQQIVVIDAQAQTMASYHIEPIHGKIQLKSVRRLAWDLTMEEFNADSPLPSELRAVQP